MEFHDSVLVKREDDTKPVEQGRQLMTFHCGTCNTVLTDSLGVAGEVQWLNSILCPRVTDDVVISDTKEFGHMKVIANCIFSSLKCGVCSSDVGKVVHSSPSHMDQLRCGFLLCKENINCYILDSSCMVKSTTLSFDQKPVFFLKKLRKTKQRFQAMLNWIMEVKNVVDDKNGARMKQKQPFPKIEPKTEFT